ncbi:hypothetical protein [Streptomyces sp. KR80]|uniref:hypothetical protein n=1 Tax=Streptomyces sp. KR80 TaxID=3457426 RepID=UPI003FD27BD6
MERITARRAKLDALADKLTEQLQQINAEREELAVAERVLRRLQEQCAADTTPASTQVAGRSVLLVPHRRDVADESALPGDYQRILGVVRAAGGPVRVKDVGAELGLEVEARGKLEPLRGKLSKLAGRGWLRKLPDGGFAPRQL